MAFAVGEQTSKMQSCFAKAGVSGQKEVTWYLNIQDGGGLVQTPIIIENLLGLLDLVFSQILLI